MNERQTAILADADEAVHLLDDDLNQHGHMPEVAGWAANERPVFLWLDEFGGDKVFLRIAVLLVGDGGTVSTVEYVRADSIEWPVEITLPREASR